MFRICVSTVPSSILRFESHYPQTSSVYFGFTRVFLCYKEDATIPFTHTHTFCEADFDKDNSSLVSVAGLNVYGLWNAWIGTFELVTYQRFAGRYEWELRKGTGGDKINCLHPHFPSISGPRAGLCHQGQRQRTVETTKWMFVGLCSINV
jgi:hypothetical protein